MSVIQMQVPKMLDELWKNDKYYLYSSIFIRLSSKNTRVGEKQSLKMTKPDFVKMQFGSYMHSPIMHQITRIWPLLILISLTTIWVLASYLLNRYRMMWAEMPTTQKMRLWGHQLTIWTAKGSSSTNSAARPSPCFGFSNTLEVFSLYNIWSVTRMRNVCENIVNAKHTVHGNMDTPRKGNNWHCQC